MHQDKLTQNSRISRTSLRPHVKYFNKIPGLSYLFMLSQLQNIYIFPQNSMTKAGFQDMSSHCVRVTRYLRPNLYFNLSQICRSRCLNSAFRIKSIKISQHVWLLAILFHKRETRDHHQVFKREIRYEIFNLNNKKHAWSITIK